MLKISRIKIEEEPVYDITVPETSSFFANDILVHNCSEIFLHSDENHTFTCVLSSMNLVWYDDWKDTDAPYVATVFLDCVAEEFIQSAKSIKGLEKAVRFTEKGRALGLGVCGFHTYTQQKGWAFEGFDTHLWNIEAFKNISEKALSASQWMATVMGEPEWCKGYGTRNTHNMAIAPTKSCVSVDTEFKLPDETVISYDTLLANNNLSNITDIKLLLEDGNTKIFKYDDIVNVTRLGITYQIYAYEIQDGDDLI